MHIIFSLRMDMFGYDTQAAHHFRTVGGVGSAYRKNRQEEH